jgi:hypothetical protein
MDFGKLFQSIEDAVYEVMVWVLLLPKTFLRSMFRPRWTIQYVNEEWEKKPEDRFDEFLSPVLLWLIVAVFPLTVSTILQNGSIKSIQDLIGALHDGLLSQALYAMIIPFTYIAWMEWMSDRPVKKSTLKRSFYIHCYALAPAQFVYALFAILTIWFDAFILFQFLSTILLVFYEVFVFQAELNISFGKALWYAIIPQLFLGVLLIFLIRFYMTPM